MKLRTTVLAVAAVLSSPVLFAQEAVVGKPDEAMFTDSDPVLHRNKQATLHIMKELLQCGQWERAAEWLTPAYHQHNPNAETGRDAVVYFFTQVMKMPRQATCDKLTTQIVAVSAEGNLVTVLVPRSYQDPRDTTKCYSTTWFDTWRFVDGKADEHWVSGHDRAAGFADRVPRPRRTLSRLASF